MKRTFIICTAVCLLALSLVSCVREKPNDVENAFFSEEYLSKFHCEGVPAPSLEDAVLRDGSELYLNVSANEYKNYVSAVIEYLRARDDVFNLSQVRTLNAVFILPYQYVCEPLRDGYISDYGIKIVFSLDGEIEVGEGAISDPVVIDIERSSGSLSSGFEYNCIMTISGGSIIPYWLDRCYSEHTYIEEELCVPCRDGAQTATQYICKWCGYTCLEECGDGESYGVTVAEGREYLKGTVPQRIKSGELYKLYTAKYMDADIVLTVNGTRLTATEAGGGELWCYTFVMPCESVEISVDLVDGFLVYQSFAMYCTRLAQLDPSSVVQIRIVDEFIGVAPDTPPKDIKLTEDSEIIADFINELREISVSEISPEDADIDGGSKLTVEFYLADGNSEILTISNGIYSENVNGENVYVMLHTSVPTLP